jgi:hypothetical protein
MKSPDGRECSTFLRHKRITLSGKRTSKFYLLNSEERLVEQIVVDSCAITEGKRCDWLIRLNDATSKEEVYVELKGSGVYDGVEQLRATIERLSVNRANYPKRCFVVFSRNPMIGTDVQKYKAQFRRTFNSILALVKDESEVAL